MKEDFQSWVEECTQRAPVLGQFGGSFSAAEIHAWTRRHYAEVRTFIDFKLPERLRICPHGAHEAKKFFCEIYAEEQGDFIPGGDHAEMFAKFALAIGVTRDELEAEYLSYLPNFEYMRHLEPSTENMVAELAISYAWESAINRIATPLLSTLDSVRAQFDLTDDQIEYFTAHISLDQHHAEAALETLLKYANTPDLENIARESIEATLVGSNPWTLSAA